MKILKSILAPVFLSAAFLFASACSWIFSDSQGDSSDLHSSKWVPASIAGQENTLMPEKGRAYISFVSRDWGVFTIYGCAGDDNFDGRAERLKDGSFHFSPVLSNLKDNRYDAYEKLFIQALKDTRLVELAEDRRSFKLYGAGSRGAKGGLLAEFSRVE